MKRLSRERRTAVLACLVEGSSIRSTCRMTGVAKATVLKLLAQAGEAAVEYLDREVRGTTARRVQCDEIWSFVGCKEKNIPAQRQGEPGIGDVWTWTALDADSKLIVSFLVGERDTATAFHFMTDLAGRLANRVQLTTDGHKPYLMAVEDTFGADIDYAQLHKLYGTDPAAETRYSPAKCIGTETTIVQGQPDPKHISTSYVERQNLSMRMGMRRFTRLTNAFSKKVQNHEHAIALYFLHYNFARPHKTLKGETPAMAAGLADHVWTIAEIVSLVEALDKPANRPAHYKPRQPKTADAKSD
jgi:IS1 family transposase